MASYFITALPFYPFLLLFPYGTRKILNFIVSFYSGLALIALDIQVKTSGDFPQGHENFLIVSNHLSYLDILSLSSFFPTSFVTSVEIKKMPVLGQITQLAGCLFVERRSRAELGKEINELCEGLKSGLNITIFPEATSTDGSGVLKFKRPLFQSALKTHSPVLPLCINYLSVNGEKIGVHNRDFVCWYGSMDFFSHLWKLVQQRKIVVQISIGTPVGEMADDSSLAQMTYDWVSSQYVPIL